METRKKVLFATFYGYESIINAIDKIGVLDNLVLFIDEETNSHQKESLKVIENVARISKTKIKTIQLHLLDINLIIKNIHTQIKKYNKYNLYFDITHSKRTQGIGIVTYLSLSYPTNLKKVTYYDKDENITVEIPIFKSESLNEIEIQCLKYISKNNMFMMSDLSKHLGCSLTHAYRVLGDLEENRYVSKGEGGYKLCLKGDLVVGV